ncbi:hypothetical protein [Streptomyces sp. NPDC060275]
MDRQQGAVRLTDDRLTFDSTWTWLVPGAYASQYLQAQAALAGA